VKRDALIRALRRYAAKNNLPIELDKACGKGATIVFVSGTP
jgi:hypothetical protein